MNFRGFNRNTYIYINKDDNMNFELEDAFDHFENQMAQFEKDINDIINNPYQNIINNSYQIPNLEININPLNMNKSQLFKDFEEKNKIIKENKFIQQLITFDNNDTKIQQFISKNKDEIIYLRKLNDKLHMYGDNPSVIVLDKNNRLKTLGYHKNGQLHRENNKPALIFCDNTIEKSPITLLMYYKNNQKYDVIWLYNNEKYLYIEDFINNNFQLNQNLKVES